jgi:hypothetical protein
MSRQTQPRQSTAEVIPHLARQIGQVEGPAHISPGLRRGGCYAFGRLAVRLRGMKWLPNALNQSTSFLVPSGYLVRS